MPKLSERAEQMPASPIRRLVPYADAAKARGIKVYHLNIGQPDIETPECAREAVREAGAKVVSYSNSAGNLSFREGLVKYYAGVGISLKASDMIVTNGGSEAITIALAACLNPGDEIIIPEPFYANYNGFAEQNGVKVVSVPSDIRSDFALPSMEEFEKRITPRTKAIMVCNPNNPTGYLYTEAEVRQLGAIAKKHDLYLLADEVYREFCYDGQRHHSVMSLPDMEEHTVLLDSVSKRYSLCGARIGELETRSKTLLAAMMKFAQARLCPPYYGQIAAEAALKAPQSYFKAVYDEYIARRDYMVHALNAMPGVFTPMPHGAFYTVVELPVDDADKFAKWLLEEYSYEGQTVMVAPASGFYSTPGYGAREARLAYVLNIDDLKRAMEVLRHALEEYPGRTR